jgi:hypothetical protein
MESFGLAALEAMACGVPAIATRVGGVSELIDDGITGRLFEVGDVEGMAAAAIALLKDRIDLSTMAHAARRAAQDRFCATRIIPLYEEYYQRVISRTGVQPMQRVRFSEVDTQLPRKTPGFYEIWTNEGKLLKIGIGRDLRIRLKQHRDSLDRRLKLIDGGRRENPADVVSKGSILAKHLYYDTSLSRKYDLTSQDGRRSFLSNECYILFQTTPTREHAEALEKKRETDPRIRYVGKVVIR